MIEAAFIFLVLFFSIFIELIIGSFHIVIPITACSIFYISINYGWKISIIIALITGLVIDVLFGRHFFYSPYTFFIVTVFSVYWLQKGELKILRLQCIPGIAVAFIYVTPIFISVYWRYDSGLIVFLSGLLNLILALILAGILLPFMVLILDAFSEKFGIPTYINAKKRLYDSNQKLIKKVLNWQRNL